MGSRGGGGGVEGVGDVGDVGDGRGHKCYSDDHNPPHPSFEFNWFETELLSYLNFLHLICFTDIYFADALLAIADLNG